MDGWMDYIIVGLQCLLVSYGFILITSAFSCSVHSEIGPNEIISYDEFERRAQAGYEGLEFRQLNENDMIAKGVEDQDVEWY